MPTQVVLSLGITLTVMALSLVMEWRRHKESQNSTPDLSTHTEGQDAALDTSVSEASRSTKRSFLRSSWHVLLLSAMLAALQTIALIERASAIESSNRRIANFQRANQTLQEFNTEALNLAQDASSMQFITRSLGATFSLFEAQSGASARQCDELRQALATTLTSASVEIDKELGNGGRRVLAGSKELGVLRQRMSSLADRLDSPLNRQLSPRVIIGDALSYVADQVSGKGSWTVENYPIWLQLRLLQAEVTRSLNAYEVLYIVETSIMMQEAQVKANTRLSMIFGSDETGDLKDAQRSLDDAYEARRTLIDELGLR